MLVTVNNDTHTINDNATLVELIGHLSLSETKGIAVAINDTVVPKARWEKEELSDNDKITIIKATQGG